MHPSHRPALRRVGTVLLVLAVVQFVAWAIPAPAGSTGVAHYLPLHLLLETVSIVVAMTVFAQGWNADERRAPGNLALLAAAFFVVGVLDFLHAASYPGMPELVTRNDSEKHLYFWLAARCLAALALLAAVVRPWQRPMAAAARRRLLAALCAAALLFVAVVFLHQDALPRVFVAGAGLTGIKKGVEYACIAVHAVTAAWLWAQMRRPLEYRAALLFGAVVTLGMSEFFFTLYTTMTGAYNVLGHVYKVIGYLFIYRAVVVAAIERPYRDLDTAHQDLELAVGASSTGLWDWQVASGEVRFTPVWKALLGYRPHEIEDRFEAWAALLHPADRETAVRRALDCIASATATGYEDEFRMRHKDGRYLWMLGRGRKQFDAQGRVVRLVGSTTDITERKRAEDRFASAIEASPTGMVMVDEQGIIVLTNSRTDALFGHPRGALIGQSIGVLIPEAQRADHGRHLRGFMAQPSERRMGLGRELSARHRDGHLFRVEVGLTPVVGHEGRYVIASVADITERVQAEQRISQLANFDPLTGLPNRSLLGHRAAQAIGVAQHEQHRAALLCVDLDHFKHINDTLGHGAGDALLTEVARRLQTVVGPADTVARTGGDEFVVLLVHADEDAAAGVAAAIIEVLGPPCQVGSHPLVVTPSIGIAMVPEDGTDFETLHQRADTAMYRAKHDGRNDFRFFRKDMQARSERMLVLDGAMRQALARGQFELHYQPQLSMDGYSVVGVEALLRWRHPELGLVSPGEFIPLAEANGQIIPIGSWVMRSAAQQLRVWLDAGLPPMSMAVNVSAVQFRHADLPGLVRRVLDEARLAPASLELELTEGVALHDPQHVAAVMDQLHACGVQLSIDDFGTGYSSLSHLKRFKVSKLKIDQSFVRDIAHNADDRAIVRAIVQMAHSLGFKTVAEGVETAAQRDFLALQGCDGVQGYLYSRPLQADQVADFVLGRLNPKVGADAPTASAAASHAPEPGGNPPLRPQSRTATGPAPRVLSQHGPPDAAATPPVHAR